MPELTQQMKQFAREHGADLIGVAPAERFRDLPARENPLSIFPEMTNAIVIGRRITRGTLRGMEEGTNLALYDNFGYSWLDMQFVASSTFETTEWLEDNGWEAVPIFPFPPEAYPQGIAVREGAPAPNVYPDMDKMAVAAGIAEMSYVRIALTPEFGHRQRWQMILTDAPLEADPLLEADLCGMCFRCVEICPLGAISTDAEETMSIAGRDYTVAKVDYSKCRRCQNGARPNRYHPSGAPDRLGAVCMRTCMQALEDSGKLTTEFANRFRVREPWALDIAGEPTQVKAGISASGSGCADPDGSRAAREGDPR
ncbi:MAG: hypothetical protein GX131_13475 [candidate division WS1 bacterium]|jgi:ferredoxin|nr:hypothetical protein [candidate division WS1 bacterium]